MLRVLVGPNGCGKTQYLNTLARHDTHINTTSGKDKLEIVKQLLAEDVPKVCIDNVDAFIDIENIEKLADMLIAASEKIDVWVSTHSILLLNYLEEDQAIESVFLVKNGNIYPYFTDSVLEKLDLMGPGEAYADTDLNAWWGEI